MNRGLAILLAVVVLIGAGWGFVRQGGDGAPVAVAPEPVATTEPAATPAPEPPAERGARGTFRHACGSCHTLRAADADGIVGPDLDELRPSAARVRRAIRTGSIDGIMQPRLLKGRDADEVAAYVARVAR